MMMRALEAGGLPPLADGVRAADEDNPRGYYELEEVKRTVHDPAWLVRAPGHAVKVIAYLLRPLPVGPRYRIVFMRRNLDEILRSQSIMLARRAAAGLPATAGAVAAGAHGAPKDAATDDAEMRRTLMAHVAETEAWLRGRPDIDVLYVSYNRMLAEPRRQMERVSRFLGGGLKVDAMVAVVEPTLYRQRPAELDGPKA